jgi:N-terminal region of micro-spherule protein
MAVQSIKQLHPDVVAALHAKALFSVEEEKLLSTVSSVNLVLDWSRQT